VGLVRVPGPVGGVGRRHADGQQLDCPLRSPDAPDEPLGQPGRPRHPTFDRAAGQAVDVILDSILDGGRGDRVVHQQPSVHEAVDEVVDVVRARKVVLVARGNVTDRSTSSPGSSLGMKVPSLNWMPKNSASWGIGTIVALVSGPRTVTCVAPLCRVTTISQWVAATEMKDASGSLRVRQLASTRRESDAWVSSVNSSAARRMPPSTAWRG